VIVCVVIEICFLILFFLFKILSKEKKKIG
jgi:hypothetical protein